MICSGGGLCNGHWRADKFKFVMKLWKILTDSDSINGIDNGHRMLQLRIVLCHGD